MTKSSFALLFCAAAVAASSLSAADRTTNPGNTRSTRVFPLVRSNAPPEIFSDDTTSDTMDLPSVGHSLASLDQPESLDKPQSVSLDRADARSTDDGSYIATTSSQYGGAGWSPLDTLSLFGGLEGSKQPQDFGVNANFGSRWAINWGFPLLADYGIGMQVGTSINQTDNAVDVFSRVGETARRTQNFSTVGVFQRTENWRWGLGYDFLYESYYDSFFLGQWRGRGGYAVTQNDEIGVWFAIAQHHDSGLFLTIPVTLTPLSQGSFYWQHQFMTGARTTVWAGMSEGHAQANLALGDQPKTSDQFVFGAEVDVPLNHYLALYGQANFISPASSGTVDSYLGLSFYPGGHAFPATRNPFTPLLALANSTMFSTNISR